MVARAVLLLALAATPASAQTIPWFEAHPQERTTTLRACRDDYRLQATPSGAATCANAEAAEGRAYGKRTIPDGLRVLDDPAYWRGNFGMMQALRTACARRAPYDAPMLRYCAMLREG